MSIYLLTTNSRIPNPLGCVPFPLADLITSSVLKKEGVNSCRFGKISTNLLLKFSNETVKNVLQWLKYEILHVTINQNKSSSKPSALNAASLTLGFWYHRHEIWSTKDKTNTTSMQCQYGKPPPVLCANVHLYLPMFQFHLKSSPCQTWQWPKVTVPQLTALLLEHRPL